VHPELSKSIRGESPADRAALFPFMASHELPRFFPLEVPRIEITRAIRRENAEKNLKPHRKRKSTIEFIGIKIYK